jgi:hypothetical protein
MSHPQTTAPRGDTQPDAQPAAEAGGAARRQVFDAAALDLSGGWLWRGSGGRSAHLVRERAVGSCNPWALCGKRIRTPRLAWRGVCPTCRSRSEQVQAESTPVRHHVLEPGPRQQAA